MIFRKASIQVTAVSSHYSPVARSRGMKSSWGSCHWAYKICFSYDDPISKGQLHPEFSLLVSKRDEIFLDISMQVIYLFLNRRTSWNFIPAKLVSGGFRAESSMTKVFEIASLYYCHGLRRQHPQTAVIARNGSEDCFEMPRSNFTSERRMQFT